MTGESSGKSNGGWTKDGLRWVAALLVAIGASVWYLAALHDQSVCHGQIPNAALRPTQVCGAPRLLDLLPFALVIGVLLWPDLGELAVTGLITLRRRVSRQEDRQSAADGRIDGLDQRLTQLSVLTQVQDQGQEQVMNLYAYPADQDELSRNIGAKESSEDEPEATKSPEPEQALAAMEKDLLEGQPIDSASSANSFGNTPGSSLTFSGRVPAFSARSRPI